MQIQNLGLAICCPLSLDNGNVLLTISELFVISLCLNILCLVIAVIVIVLKRVGPSLDELADLCSDRILWILVAIIYPNSVTPTPSASSLPTAYSPWTFDVIFSRLLLFVSFWSRVLRSPLDIWYTFLFCISLGVYIPPNTVLTTSPTLEQTAFYKARKNLIFFLILYLLVFSFFHPGIAIVVSSLLLSVLLTDITIKEEDANTFLSQVAARLGTTLPTTATPAPTPASTPAPTPANATPISSTPTFSGSSALRRGRPNAYATGIVRFFSSSASMQSKTRQRSLEDYRQIFNSLDPQFIEWFVGFSDAESNFLLHTSGGNLQLMFQIGLHLDDLPVLEALKDKFQCGYITVSHKEQKANYVISPQEALLGLLVPIFDSFNLNTTKYLDFMNFREAVMMRITSHHLTPEGRERIAILKASMNKRRTDFTLPSNHKLVVTLPWLLGLIEGDGSFSFNGVVPRLSIQLSIRQEYVLKAIQAFFGGVGNLRIEAPRSHVSPEGSYISNPMVILEFNRIAFLRNVIVADFKGLSLLTKKGLDFADWSICVEVYFTGRHTLQPGNDLILLLKSRMNNNRLSTNLDNRRDLVIAESQIDAVFNLPAPYEVRKGARYLADTNKLVPEPFPVYVTHPDGSSRLCISLSQCASATGISRFLIRKHLDSGNPYNGFFFSSTRSES